MPQSPQINSHNSHINFSPFPILIKEETPCSVIPKVEQHSPSIFFATPETQKKDVLVSTTQKVIPKNDSIRKQCLNKKFNAVEGNQSGLSLNGEVLTPTKDISLTPFKNNFSPLHFTSPLLKETFSPFSHTPNNSNHTGKNGSDLPSSTAIISTPNNSFKTPFSENFSPNFSPGVFSFIVEDSSPLHILSDVSASPSSYRKPSPNGTNESENNKDNSENKKDPKSMNKQPAFKSLFCNESLDHLDLSSPNPSTSHNGNKSLLEKKEHSVPNKNSNSRFNIKLVEEGNVISPVSKNSQVFSFKGDNSFNISSPSISSSTITPSTSSSSLRNPFSIKVVQDSKEFFTSDKKSEVVFTFNGPRVTPLSTQSLLEQIEKNNNDIMYKKAESFIMGNSPVHFKRVDKENLENSRN